MCPPGWWGWPGPGCHSAAPGAVVLLLLLPGAGGAGEADTEKPVTAVSKPEHSVRFTHHSMGKGFSLP